MDGRTYLRRLSDALVHAQRPIRILKALNWPDEVHRRFFRQKARELPRPEVRPLDYDPRDKVAQLESLRRKIRGRNPIEQALRRKCDEFVEVVRMLQARGTKRFYAHSVRLYGEPRRVFQDSGVDNLEIARLWATRPYRPGSPMEPRPLSAREALAVVQSITAPILGERCRLKISRRLTADAAAGATSVAVRAEARFSHRQARALAHHEGLWHVLTSLNGYDQPVLTVLGVGLAGFATSQEGGGVVAELLSGNMTAERLRELGERALSVDLVAQGADYLELFRYLSHRFSPEKAAQLCERVFRGGVLTGGAPFTKDAIYQRGYCRVFNFLRHTVENGETSLFEAFFAGKMSVDDTPFIDALMHEGLVAPPRLLPPWAADQEGLGAQIVHSLTMSRFDLGKVSRYYEKLVQKHRGGLGNWEAGLTARGVDPDLLPDAPPPPATRNPRSPRRASRR